jgi:hypothetical protein
MNELDNSINTKYNLLALMFGWKSDYWDKIHRIILNKISGDAIWHTIFYTVSRSQVWNLMSLSVGFFQNSMRKLFFLFAPPTCDQMKCTTWHWTWPSRTWLDWGILHMCQKKYEKPNSYIQCLCTVSFQYLRCQVLVFLCIFFIFNPFYEWFFLTILYRLFWFYL